MFYDYVQFMWMLLAVTILLCELYVPYRQKLFLSIALSGSVCILISEFIYDVFIQCIFFISLSAIIYCTFSAALFFWNKIKKLRKNSIEIIALCDIPNNSYGAVYHSGKSQIIKNDYGKIIKKGEALRIDPQDLEGESVV